MALLTVQQIDLDGEQVDFVAAAAGGDTFVNNGKTFIEVFNNSGSSITVTIDSVQNCNQGFDHNAGATVLTGTVIAFGPFPTSRFNDASGITSVTYSSATNVTVSVLSL